LPSSQLLAFLPQQDEDFLCEYLLVFNEVVVIAKIKRKLVFKSANIEASKGFFHCSTHILQLVKTNIPHVTR